MFNVLLTESVTWKSLMPLLVKMSYEHLHIPCAQIHLSATKGHHSAHRSWTTECSPHYLNFKMACFHK